MVVLVRTNARRGINRGGHLIFYLGNSLLIYFGIGILALFLEQSRQYQATAEQKHRPGFGRGRWRDDVSGERDILNLQLVEIKSRTVIAADQNRSDPGRRGGVTSKQGIVAINPYVRRVIA